ncbi:hypothetical protein KSL88_11745 [Pectobacterium polaris]|uniref:hypothetical protein n=1 Tax=Pectobacterium polaris TaxID=2042057 RepID=UPI001CC81492|nr:hypothetical protein [Pectobacterium polaris]UAY90229.1 hypothetical protein KSL88_11745 [Pectobacterium polaris]
MKTIQIDAKLNQINKVITAKLDEMIKINDAKLNQTNKVITAKLDEMIEMNDAKLNQTNKVIKGNSEGTLGHLQGKNIKNRLDKIHSKTKKLKSPEREERQLKVSELKCQVDILCENHDLQASIVRSSDLTITKKRL